MKIPLARIKTNPNQPRKRFNEDSIRELAQSIKENGLVQPITVEDNGDGSYTLVGGERRLRATYSLGDTEIEAFVREKSNHGGRELLIGALVENVQREDMNALDEAEAYQRMRKEFGMRLNEIGLKVGKHPTMLQRRLILLDLEPEIQQLIRDNKITVMAEVWREVLKIPNSDARVALAKRAAEQGLSYSQIIATAKKMTSMMESEKIDLQGSKSPAMALAKQKTWEPVDEDTAPEHWNALRQLKRVPPWDLLTDRVTLTCKNCSLAESASAITCGACPLVDLLSGLVRP